MHCFLARYGINTATTQQCFPLRLFAGRAPSEKVPGLRKKRLWEPVAAAFGQLFSETSTSFCWQTSRKPFLRFRKVTPAVGCGRNFEIPVSSFRGRSRPERHRPYKVCAADLFHRLAYWHQILLPHCRSSSAVSSILPFSPPSHIDVLVKAPASDRGFRDEFS